MYKRMLFLILFLVLCWPAGALAQGGLSMAAAGGFDGYVRADAWMPIYVTLANEGAAIDGQIEVSTTGSWDELVYVQPAVLPTHSNKQFTLYVFGASGLQQVAVRLVQGGQTLAEDTVRIETVIAPDLLYGVVSDDPAALHYLAGLSTPGQARVHVAHLGLDDLPAQGRILSGIDALILDNVDTSTLDEGRRGALWAWVAAGGRLIVCGGPNAELTAAGLGELLPVTLNGSETTADLSALGAYAGQTYSADTPLVVTRVTPASSQAYVLAGSAERPLLVRRTLDQGSIDYLALDPDLEPLRTWAGNEALWHKLLAGSPQVAGAMLAYNGSSMQQGVTNIPSLDIPSVLIVAGFLLLYVVVVGPANLIVLKLTDRRSWAWITIPLLVVLFSCVAYAVGLVSRGRSVIVSSASIVRTFNQSQTASVDSFVALYSPARLEHDVRLPDQVPTAHRIIYPYYVPGAAVESSELRIEQGPPNYVRDLQVDVGAVRTFSMHTLQPWAGIKSELELESGSGSSLRVKGTIANLGEHTLTDCVVIVRGAQTYDLPDLAPGAAHEIDLPFYSGSGQPPVYVFVPDILDDTGTSSEERREYERRRNILTALLEGNTFSSQPVSALPSDLVLIAWTDQSPLPVEMAGVINKDYATTLLVAPLPYTAADAGGVVLPTRSLSWEQIDGPSASPYEIQNDLEPRTYHFYLPPEAQDMAVDQLFLHLDSWDTTSSIPLVSLWNVDGGAWQRVNGLGWGANPLTDPQQFVDEQGTIQIKVTPLSSYATLSVDLSVIGHR